MELWTKADGDKPKTVGFRVSEREKERIEELRRLYRLRTQGDVLRIALAFLEEMQVVMSLIPPEESEQKRLFGAVNHFAQTLPEGLTGDQVADRAGAYLEEMLKSGVRVPLGEPHGDQRGADARVQQRLAIEPE